MMRIKMKGIGGVVYAAATILAIVPRIQYTLAYEIFRLILQNSNNINSTCSKSGIDNIAALCSEKQFRLRD